MILTKKKQKSRLYSVVVITFGFDPDNPSSNLGTTFFALLKADPTQTELMADVYIIQR